MKSLLLILIAVAAVAATWYGVPAFPQDPAYHNFADTRQLYGINNFWNIATNAVILVVAIAGIIRSTRLSEVHVYAGLRRQFGILFTAALLTALASAWYHLQPGNTSLVVDRLGIAVVIAAFLSVVISIYISSFGGKLLLWPLIAAGLASVIYWHRTELAGAGDLRFYALAQYLPIAMVLIILSAYRGIQRPTITLMTAILLYGAAKAAEHFDAEVLEYSGVLSGHSVKHILAGLGLLMVYLILQRKHA